VLVLVDGSRVESLRNRAGMDEERCASLAGISVKTLREMECSNHHRPKTVRKVAKVLGVNPRSLALPKGALLRVVA
jgi:transcriptional regulator with XRE-family HTH domain